MSDTPHDPSRPLRRVDDLDPAAAPDRSVGPAVLAIFGPTTVGKTAVAVAISRLLIERGERPPVAVGVDALQVYRELPILTAQPTRAELTALEHRLVGFLPVEQNWSVGKHSELAHDEIDHLRAERRRPIVVGGTGLYLRAALTELELAPPPEPGVREELMDRAHYEGLDALYAELQQLDPAAAAIVVPGDTTRVLRALELHSAGRSLAREQVANELWTTEVRVPTVLVGLTMDREELRRRAESRMREMVGAGVVQEVRAVRSRAGDTARAAVGFRELLAGDPETAVTRTRQLIKRQQTWMKKLGGVQLIDTTHRDPAAVAEEIVAMLPDAPPAP